MKLSKLLALGLLSSGLVISSCGGSPEDGDSGGPSSDPSHDWMEITKEEFATYFTEKEDAPWTHMEGTNGVEPRDESGNLTMKTIVEDFVDPNWVVDTSKSYEGAYDLSDVLVLTQYTLDTFLNPPEGTTVTFKKKGNQAEKFQMIIHMEDDNFVRDAFSELDRYFYATDMIVRSNANESHVYRVDQEAHVTWSMTLEGHTFKFFGVEEEDYVPNEMEKSSKMEFKAEGVFHYVTTLPASLSPSGVDVVSTVIGTYEQTDANNFTYSLYGVETGGEYHPYPEGWEQVGLTGKIDGKRITVDGKSSDGTRDIHAIYVLDK